MTAGRCWWAWCAPAAAGCAPALRSRSCLYLFFGAVAGERQEHVVEAWSGQPDVIDVDIAVAQPARDPDHVSQAVGGRRHLARAGVDEHFGTCFAEHRLRGRKIAGVGDCDNQAGGTRLLLELQRRALCDDAALFA